MRRILLINPTMTKARNARFPLALLHLSAALDGRYETTLIDGNMDRDFVAASTRLVAGGTIDAVGVSVMGGPQLLTAIEVSRAVRAHAPRLPIIWGGHFPTIISDAGLNNPYVDYLIRGQGEDTLLQLLDALFEPSTADLSTIDGLSWRQDGRIVHNKNRAFSAAALLRELPYDRLADPQRYVSKTFLGQRTAGHQAALGCRFRCTFCGVASMFRGKTALPAANRLERDLTLLTSRFGADSIQYFDHNFFDREEDTAPLLEVMARFELPWWCYARADALMNLSESSWKLVRRSRLRMAYIGAESPSDWLLHDIRKGTSTDQTLDVVDKCRANGVIPTLSFMLAPPQDPEGETERTFEFIRHIKRVHPQSEIMLYIYAPLPAGPVGHLPHVERTLADLRDVDGAPLRFPTTADEWAQPRWLNYYCHNDVPWLTPRLRRRIQDFTTVLGCRFPTITDVRSPQWGRNTLRALASWRYRYQRYASPWELNVSKRFIRLWDPRLTSL